MEEIKRAHPAYIRSAFDLFSPSFLFHTGFKGSLVIEVRYLGEGWGSGLTNMMVAFSEV